MIEFDASSRIFSIYPVATSHEVWVCGTRFVKTGTETVTIDASSGLNYIYYDASGTLGAQKSFFIWDQQAPTAYIYYNADHPEESMLFDERHGITMDWATHEYLHRTRGAAIASGLVVSLYATQTGSSIDDGKINVSSGTFFDEDLQVDISSAPVWNQNISGPGLIPVVYRNGSGEWRKSTAIAYPILSPTNYPRYNQLSGGSWVTTDLANGKYGIYWIVATNMVTTPVISIMGQAEYNSLTLAQQVTWSSLTLTGFPVIELRPLARVIYEVKNTYTSPNPFHAIIADITDIRTLIPLIATGLTFKTFVIEHPIDISRYLVHACLEGPEAGVYYRGDAVIAEGDIQVTITLPPYAAVIATDFTVQLTPIDEPRLLAASRVVNGRFTVRGPPGSFYWQVTGRRETLEAEPLKAIVNVQGDGPYRWINNA